MMFNALDYLLIFFLLVGSLWGLVRGAGRLLITLFSLYVGLVISLLLYQPLGNFFRDLLPGMSITGSETLAFIILLLAFVNGFNFLTRYFTTPPEERKRKKKGGVEEAVTKGGERFLAGPLNQLVGLLVGFFVTIVWTSLLVAVLQFAVRTSWPAANQTRVAVQGQLGTSVLVPVFGYALSRIYLSVRIWVPGDVPSIFAELLQQI